jgi:hypothetical protein
MFPMRPTQSPHLFRNPVGMLNASTASIAVVGRRVLRLSSALAVVLCLALSAAAQEYNKNKPDQALKADARALTPRPSG